MSENNTEMDTRQLIEDTAAKMFADHCDKAVQDAAERGEFAQALHRLVAESGFDQLGSTDSGTDMGDLCTFLFQCGRAAVPLPLAETALVNRWCGVSEGVGSIGVIAGEEIVDVPWGVPRTGWLVLAPAAMRWFWSRHRS